MNCRETENMMQEVLDCEISYKDAGEFLEHIDNCSKCMDEFEIRYLLQEGLTKLEQGQVFDVDEGLKKLLERHRNNYNLYSWFKYLLFSAGVMLTLILLYFISGR